MSESSARHRGTTGPLDIHTTAGKLAELERRLDEAVRAGRREGASRSSTRRAARPPGSGSRLLFDEGSFVELDELARHRSTTSAWRSGGPTATA